MEVKLTGCKVTGLRADMLKGSVSLTLKASLDEELMDALRQLRMWDSDKSFIDVELTEQQMRLPFERGEEPIRRPGDVIAEEPIGEARPFKAAERESGYEQGQRQAEEDSRKVMDALGDMDEADLAHLAHETAHNIQEDVRDLGMDRPRDELEAGEH